MLPGLTRVASPLLSWTTHLSRQGTEGGRQEKCIGLLVRPTPARNKAASQPWNAAGTQQDAFKTYSVKWGSAHNRIVSEKSRKQIINTDLNCVCIYTSNSPKGNTPEWRPWFIQSCCAIKKFSFFFSLIVFFQYSVISTQYVSYQKKAIYRNQVIKPGALLVQSVHHGYLQGSQASGLLGASESQMAY